MAAGCLPPLPRLLAQRPFPHALRAALGALRNLATGQNFNAACNKEQASLAERSWNARQAAIAVACLPKLVALLSPPPPVRLYSYESFDRMREGAAAILASLAACGNGKHDVAGLKSAIIDTGCPQLLIRVLQRHQAPASMAQAARVLRNLATSIRRALRRSHEGRLPEAAGSSRAAQRVATAGTPSGRGECSCSADQHTVQQRGEPGRRGGRACGDRGRRQCCRAGRHLGCTAVPNKAYQLQPPSAACMGGSLLVSGAQWRRGRRQ